MPSVVIASVRTTGTTVSCRFENLTYNELLNVPLFRLASPGTFNAPPPSLSTQAGPGQVTSLGADTGVSQTGTGMGARTTMTGADVQRTAAHSEGIKQGVRGSADFDRGLTQ